LVIIAGVGELQSELPLGVGVVFGLRGVDFGAVGKEEDFFGTEV
jgi:hypothetical protein